MIVKTSRRQQVAGFRVRSLRRVAFPSRQDLFDDADTDAFLEYVDATGLVLSDYPTDDEVAEAEEEARIEFDSSPEAGRRIDEIVSAWKSEALKAQINLKAALAIARLFDQKPVAPKVERPTPMLWLSAIEASPNEIAKRRPASPNAPPLEFTTEVGGLARTQTQAKGTSP